MAELNINNILDVTSQAEFYTDGNNMVHARFTNGEDIVVTQLSPGLSVGPSWETVEIGSLNRTSYDGLTDDEADAAIGYIPINYNSTRVAEAVCDAYCRLMTLTMDRMNKLRGQPDLKNTLVKTMHAAKNKILRTIKEATDGQS